MKFKTLQDNLRKTLWRRIEARSLTGLKLANDTGFKQAHISNFLNRKRGLSVEGMDKVLNVQHLSVLDLLDGREVNKRATVLPAGDNGFENVALVEGPVAASQRRIMSMKVKEIVKFKKTFLRRLRTSTEGDRQHWQRFVAITAGKQEGMSMYPRLQPGANLLIDRHYNSLQPYHKGQSNIYAVNHHGHCTLKYVEQAGNYLVLRPHNQSYPVEIIRMDHGKKVRDYLIGRVCYVGIEI
jgi:hypothetical protein